MFKMKAMMFAGYRNERLMEGMRSRMWVSLIAEEDDGDECAECIDEEEGGREREVGILAFRGK